jgi:hypothetical protein
MYYYYVQSAGISFEQSNLSHLIEEIEHEILPSSPSINQM